MKSIFRTYKRRTFTVLFCLAAIIGLAPAGYCQPPTVTAGNSGPTCQGTALQLTATVTGGTGPTFSWSGPNGFTSTVQNPTINNAGTNATGTYTVQVFTAGNPAVVATTSAVIVSNGAVGVATNSPVCTGNALVMAADTVAGASYQWTGPNNFLSHSRVLTVPNVGLADAGTYTLLVSRPGCQEFIRLEEVTVNDPAFAAITTNSPVCGTGTIQVSASAAANATYVWSGPNSFTAVTQTASVANATASDAGTYGVLIAVPGCAPGVAFADVQVNVFPSGVALTSNSPVCAGSPLALAVTPVTGAAYTWSGPSPAISGSTTNSATENAATTANSGTYSVAIDLPGCNPVTFTAVATVNAPPQNVTANSNTPVCAGTSINLTASSTVGASYQWSGPNNYSSTLQNPTRNNATAAMAGTYNVTVTVPGCSSAFASTDVAVSAFPANPTVTSNSPLCSGGSLSLTATTITGATYSWAGPSPAISGGTTASVLDNNATSQNAGTYAVTISLPGCSPLTLSTSVIVNDSLQAITANSNTPVCLGGSLNLTAPTISGATYSWSGPGTYTSTLKTPHRNNATLAMGGDYTVTASVPGCPSVSATVNVVVNATPTFIATNNGPVCLGGTLQLNAPSFSANAPTTYVWSGPNGYASTVQNPSIVGVDLSSTGTYSVQAITSGCQTLTSSTDVTVIVAPAITAANNSPVCEGGAIALSVTTVPGATYEWAGPNGFTFTGSDTLLTDVTTDMAGVYTITVSAPGCNAVTANTIVDVNPTPAVSAGSNGPICAGTTLQLTANVIAGATYFWEGPGIGGANVTTPTPTLPAFSITGDLSFVVTVSVPGCAPVDTVVNVTVNPVSPITAGSNTPVCEGGTLQLTASTLSGATYAWTGPGGFAAAAKDTSITSVTPDQSGVYIVTATVAGCDAQTAQVTVSVTPTPVVNVGSDAPLCTGESLQLTATTIANATYSWTGPGMTTGQSTKISPKINNVTVAGTLNYVVVVTVAGCAPITASTDVLVVAPPTVTATSNGPICVGQTLELYASNVDNGIFLWSGPGIDSTNKDLQNPKIVAYSLTGTNTYTVIASKPECLTTAMSSVSVLTKKAPKVFVGNNGPLCEGQTMITYAGTVPGATYSWTGPDGFTSTQQNFFLSNITTTQGGFYSLTVNVGGCTNVPPATTVVYVKQAPVAPAIGNNGPLCFGQTLLLSSEPMDGVTYLWSGPSNFSSTQANPSIQNVNSLNSGTYFLRVQKDGCTSQATTTTPQLGKLTAPVIGNNGPVCEGETLNLTSVPISGVTYEWSGPNNFSSTEANPSIADVTTTVAGTYFLITTANGCSSDPTPTLVKVRPRPTASLNSGDQEICVGQESATLAVTLTGKSPWTLFYAENGVNKTEQFSSSVSPAAFSIELNPTETTTYSLVNILDGNGCETLLSEQQFVVTVNPLPTVNFSGENTAICIGESFDLGLKVTGKGPWTINYTINGLSQTEVFGDENSTSPATFSKTVSPVEETLYQLTSVFDGAGCFNVLSDKLTVSVNDVPNAALTATAFRACSGSSATLTFNVTDVGETTNWKIRFTVGTEIKEIDGTGPGTTTFTTEAITDTTAVTLLATFNADAPACIRALTQTAIISADSLPTVSASAEEPSCGFNGGGITTTTTGGAGNYRYSLDGVDFSNSAGSFTGLTPGDYTVIVKDAQGCRDTSAAVTIGSLPKPTMVSVKNIGITAATATWTKILGSKYRLEYRPAGSGLPYSTQNVTSGDTTASVLDLIGNTTYEIRVRSVCPLGAVSDASDTLMFTTLPYPCKAPATITATPVTGDKTKVDISWTSAITASCYTLQYRRLNTATWTSINNLTDAQQPYRLSGLTAGQTYQVRMRTNCVTCPASGTSLSSFSAIQNFTQPSNSGGGTCTLTSFSINDGATSATGCGSVLLTPTVADNASYIYQWRRNGVNITGATQRTYTATSSGNYTVVVSESDACPPVTSATILVSVSGVPFSVVASATNATCSTCTDGTISATATTSQEALVFEYSLSGAATRPFQSANLFSGLGAGSYTVTARETASGCTRTTNVTVGVTAALGTPTITNVSSITSNRATIEWAAVSGALTYLLQYRVSGATDWTSVSGLAGVSRTITGLQAGTTYEARLQAFGSGGAQSAFSSVATFTTTTLTGSCLSPTGVFVNNISANSVVVNWTSANGAACYDLDYRTGASWTTVTGASVQSPYTLSGLSASQIYQIRLRTNCQSCPATGSNLSVYTPTTSFTTTAAKDGEVIVNQPKTEDGFTLSVYPNPNKGNFNLSLENASEQAVRVRVLDASGRLMHAVFDEGERGARLIEFPLNLSAGIYLLEVRQGEKVKTTKVVVN